MVNTSDMLDDIGKMKHIMYGIFITCSILFIICALICSCIYFNCSISNGINILLDLKTWLLVSGLALLITIYSFLILRSHRRLEVLVKEYAVAPTANKLNILFYILSSINIHHPRLKKYIKKKKD